MARKPKKGRVKTLTVTGRLVLPKVRPAPRCTGKVRVRALAGKRVLASRTVSLKARKGVCRFATVLRPKKLRTAKQISVNATFLGNTQLKARSAQDRQGEGRPPLGAPRARRGSPRRPPAGRPG